MEIKKPNPYKESKIKPKFCGTRKELNDEGVYEKFPQSLYKIRWKYVTNKSGSKEFFFTGREIDANLTKFAEAKKICPGDIVVLNKKGHPNDGVKAKVKKVTKSITGLEAKKKGIQEDKNLPKYYDLKFIHPPVINLKRVKHAKDVDGKYLTKINVKKTYKCIPPHYELEDKLKDELSRFTNLHFTKGTPFQPEQILAIESQTRSKKTLVLDKFIKPQKKDKFQILRTNYISHTEPKWNKKKTHKNIEVLVRIDLTTVPPNILSNITSHLNCRGRKKQLKCDVKEVYKDILGGIESLIAPEPQWKIKDKKEDDPFKRPGWCNLSYKESCVNPFHTPKNDGRDKDGVKSVTENFKEKDEKKKATEKARALAKKLNKEDELDGRGDDIPTKRDDADEGEVLERKDSDPPKRNKKGGADPNQITQNIETKMDDIVNEPQDPLTNILGAPPEGPVPPAAPAPMDIIEDEDDAGQPVPLFDLGDEVIFEGNRYRILRVDGINNNGIGEYTIVPIDTNTDPMMAPRNARENELTLATATPEPPLWQQHLLMTPAQQAWLEEDQEGGGLTKEEIQKWFEYFDNEINENDDSVMNFSLSLLPKDENETLLNLF